MDDRLTSASADFTLRSDGVYRINPEMAKHIVGLLDLKLSSTELFRGHPTLISAIK